MADPAPTNIPTISSAVMSQMMQYWNSAIGNPGGTPTGDAGQGVGQSYTSMVPVYLQKWGDTSGAGTSIPLPTPGQDPVFDWLTQNGYLAEQPGQNTVTAGWRSTGLTGTTVQKGTTSLPALSAAGNYSPSTDVGSGWGVGNNLLIAPNNPYGVSTQGALDVREIETPAQAPGAFGTGAFGDATVNKQDLVQNTDIWTTLVPLMEMAASIGFGIGPEAVGGPLDDLGSVFSGLFNTAGSDIMNSGNGQSTINPGQILPIIMRMFGQGAGNG